MSSQATQAHPYERTLTRHGPLVSTDWLAARIGDPALRLVEVDEDPSACVGARVRGAVPWYVHGDLYDAARRILIGQAGLIRLLGRSGVGPETTVVLLGGHDNHWAVGAFWLVRHLGFDRLLLLDGGRSRWTLEDRELVAGATAIDPADPGPLGPVRDELAAFRADLLRHLAGTGPAVVGPRSVGVRS
jgi:thiosulfate/3-mercaptopyruvate sulfurtransferase